MSNKIAIVAPCHIPPSEAWIHVLEVEAEANKATVIIVDDSDGKLGELPKAWKILDYKEQKSFLGELYDEFAQMFHKSSACRIVGHLWAYKHGFEIIIGLDSDCIVERNFVRDHTAYLGKEWGSGWFNPIGYPHYSRGYPYSQRGWPISANMGLWRNVLDINGKDRAEGEPKEIRIIGNTVPAGFFPFSGMNFSLAKNAVFGFLFLPNFKYGENDFRRIDDVWGGYIFEKLLQRAHQSSMVGYPFVYHDTVVIPEEDAAEEAAMYKYEDEFIALVDECFERMNKYSRDPASIPDMMLDFINHWQHCSLKPFSELNAAFAFWEKAIAKYA